MLKYKIAGLSVDSDFRFPGMVSYATSANSRAQVSIRNRDGPAPMPDIAMHVVSNSTRSKSLDITLEVLSGLSFRVKNGCDVEIFRASTVPDADVNLYLIGTVFGILCHQRKLLPLHCSAIEIKEKTIAFTGNSGDGKSTLAAGLSCRGYNHLSDDVMAIEFGAKSLKMTALPKGLKLCNDAIEHLAIERGLPVSSLPGGKHYVPLANLAPDSVPMAIAMYVLAYNDSSDQAVTIKPLLGSTAWQELYRSVYRVELMPLINSHATVARQLAVVARQMPLFRFSRPRGLNQFDAGLDILELHMNEIVTASIIGADG